MKKRVNLYVEASDRSPKETRKRFGYVLECELLGEIETREGFGEADATYHRAVMLGMIAGIRRINRPCELHLYSRDAFTLSMLEGQLTKWAQNGFRTRTGSPVKNEQEWRKLWRLCEKQEIKSHAERTAIRRGSWEKWKSWREENEQNERI